MNSVETVRRTLAFESPERVARSCGDSDFVFSRYIPARRQIPWTKAGDGRWERIDEWGNTWARLDSTSKGEVVRGALDEITEMDRYELPDYSRGESYGPVREAHAKFPGKWLIGELPGFTFGIARKLRRLDNYLVDLLHERDRIRALHDRIDDMLVTMIQCYASAGVDCVMIWEDWGTQDQLVINPVEWRKEFRPRFERLGSAANDKGIRVFMHSCGQIQSIVPDLIQSGIDVLQFDQPDLHGIDVLARYQERYKITFWCPVDIQKTLQLRDETAIRTKAREMLDKLWKGRGGFIAGYYEDNSSIGLDQRWQEYASDEFLSSGIQGRYVAASQKAR
jgi:hypothetical protein